MSFHMTYIILNHLTGILSVWPHLPRILCITQPISHCTTLFIIEDEGSMFLFWIPRRLLGVTIQKTIICTLIAMRISPLRTGTYAITWCYWYWYTVAT